ncbi:formate dehydrogenase accessory sulfurtransferase FdhD [Marivivens niveibacter]|nr:formate dehydrogenase accessory sulfurtransferase FdhD [Marivivens niveibacter]
MTRVLPQEVPVAIVFNGTTQAVMMATPDKLDAFGIGFALTEGTVTRGDEIETLEVIRHAKGYEVRMWVSDAAADRMAERRRSMMGPVGCGLCGIDSLDQAVRDVPRVISDFAMTTEQVRAATADLRNHQPLHDQTRAVHGAAFWQGDIIAACEDVGRHNALDKLIGTLMQRGIDPEQGAIVLTSRVSIDMVQKVAILGAPILIAVSAPTAQAIEIADKSNLTVAALSRGDHFETFTHPERIRP